MVFCNKHQTAETAGCRSNSAAIGASALSCLDPSLNQARDCRDVRLLRCNRVAYFVCIYSMYADLHTSHYQISFTISLTA